MINLIVKAQFTGLVTATSSLTSSTILMDGKRLLMMVIALTGTGVITMVEMCHMNGTPGGLMSMFAIEGTS